MKNLNAKLMSVGAIGAVCGAFALFGFPIQIGERTITLIQAHSLCSVPLVALFAGSACQTVDTWYNLSILALTACSLLFMIGLGRVILHDET